MPKNEHKPKTMTTQTTKMATTMTKMTTKHPKTTMTTQKTTTTIKMHEHRNHVHSSEENVAAHSKNRRKTVKGDTIFGRDFSKPKKKKEQYTLKLAAGDKCRW